MDPRSALRRLTESATSKTSTSLIVRLVDLGPHSIHPPCHNVNGGSSESKSALSYSVDLLPS